MTDRLNALIVVLEQDIREDDARPLIQAISQLRGVASVQPNVADIASHIAHTRARHEIETRLFKALREET